MSQRANADNESCRMSRRSLLIAAVVGGSIASPAWMSQGWATEPAVREGKSLSAKTAELRLVRASESRVIRLKPISNDFQTTIVQAIAVDPRGELIAVAGDDHAIRILETATLQLKATLQGHTDLIQSLDFDATGNQLVSTGNDGLLMLWNRNADFQMIQRMQGTPAFACVRFSPDGQEIAAVGFENKVHLFGRAKSTSQPQAICDCTDLRAVGYRHDGKLLAVAGRSGDLHLFDRTSNELLEDRKIHTGRIHDLRFNESSPVVVSAAADGCVVLFDTEAKKIVRRISVTSGKLFSVCILDRQHLAVAGSDNVIRIVDVTQGATVCELTGHTGSIAALASSGNTLFSGGYDTTLRRWQLSGLEGDRERIAEHGNPIDR